MLQVPQSIVPFVQSQFPAFYGEEGPQFIAFVEAYYEWLSISQDRQVLANRDIDLAADSFLENFKNTYLPDISFDAVTNKRLLVKNAIDIYRSKGTPRGIDLFMKLVYGSGADVYFPGEDVLRPSDARWTLPRFIEVSKSPRSASFSNKLITGAQSGATCFVESVIKRKIPSGTTTVLNVSNIQGEFMIGEALRTVSVFDNSPTVVGSPLTGTIVNGGANFQKYQDLTFINDRGNYGIARVVGVDAAGAITKVNVIESGVGFNDGDTVYLQYAGTTGATMTVKKYPAGVMKGYSTGATLGRSHIHDGDYYQDFSYDVLSAIPYDKYKTVLKKVLHIAGNRSFGSVVIQSENPWVGSSESVITNNGDLSVYSIVALPRAVTVNRQPANLNYYSLTNRVILGAARSYAIAGPAVALTYVPITGGVTTPTITIDNAKQAPTMTLTSVSTYPPELSFILPVTSVAGETLRVETSVGVSFGTLLSSETVVIATPAPDTNIWVFPGLGNRTSPMETYIRSRMENGTTSCSPWSIVRKHGDVTAPTITSSNYIYVPENSPVLHALTANETIAFWTIDSSYGDGALLEMADATHIRLVGNASPDYEGPNRFYNLKITAEDFGGNKTIQFLTVEVTDVFEIQPQVMNRYDKKATVVVSADGLTVSGQAQNGSQQGVRSINQVYLGTDVYFEVKILSADSIYSSLNGIIGIATANYAIGVNNNNPPGNGNNQGMSFGLSQYGSYVSTGSVSPNYGLSNPALNDVYMVRIRRSNAGATIMWLGKNGSWGPGTNFTTGTGGYSPEVVMSSMFVYLATMNDNQYRANFSGVVPFVHTQPSGTTVM